MKSNRTYFAIIGIVFTVIFLVLATRAHRFVDEDIAITHGYYFIKSFFTSDQEIRKHAAQLDSGNSIGVPVTVLAAAAFFSFRDILAVHLAMGTWFIYFIFSILFLASSVWIHLKTRMSRQNSTHLEPFYALALVCFVQAIPNSYMNQAFALSEFPGAASVLIGLGLFLRQRYRFGAMFLGVAIVFKVYYVLFLPVVAIAGYLSSKWSIKNLSKLALCAIAPAIGLQILKLAAFGPTNYFAGWDRYLSMAVGQSGFAKANQTPIGVNEFPNYSWRTQAYWYLGAYAPVVLATFLAVVRNLRKQYRAALFLFASVGLCCLLGGAHWMHVAVYKWWRRAYPFLIPGYATLVAVTLAIYFAKLNQTKSRMIRTGGLVALLLLALYVQVRQTIVSVIQNNTVISISDRKTWKFPEGM